MPSRNWVTPFGEITATQAKGLLMGNRGILADKDGRLRRLWKHKGWICCVTKLGNGLVPPKKPFLWTPLFFLDEAVALAAGHRPCAWCRKDDYDRFAEAWPAKAPVLAKKIDETLHKERVDPVCKEQLRHTAEFDGLPSGTFVALNGEAWLVRDTSLARYTPSGYDECVPKPSGSAVVLTPP